MTRPIQIVPTPEASRPGPDRQVEALAELDGTKLLAITLRRGTELADHQVPGPISIQVAEGRVTLTAAGEVHELGPGQTALVGGGVRHALRPVGDDPVVVLLHRFRA